MIVVSCKSLDHEKDLKNTRIWFIQRKVPKCCSQNKKVNKEAFDDI